MKVKYIGKDRIGIDKDAVYDVISEKHGCYEVYLPDFGESYFIPATAFEIVEK